MSSKNHLIPDLLAPNLRLVFCGTAPSAISAREKAYYANPGNQFWRTLYRIGLTPRLFTPTEYPELLTLGIGLTDLCKTVSGNDDELPQEALECNVVARKIGQFQPKTMAFTSKNAAAIYFGRKTGYGLQEDRLGSTRYYVLSSSSGRARRFWQEDVWLELANLYHI